MSDGVTAAIPERYLAGLEQDDLLVRLDWPDWLDINAPHDDVPVKRQEVATRYTRNGYDWDMHGSLFLPEREVAPGLAFVMFHGGACSENVFDYTPDGRPGLGRVLAAQGYKALAITFPGHWSPEPGGRWSTPVGERQPIYLLDRVLERDEIHDRNLRCTFNVILQGAAQLADTYLKGHRVIAFGHSTGGPMAAALAEWTQELNVIGIVGFASGGPDGWLRAWRIAVEGKNKRVLPLDHISRRSPATFKASGYEGDRELCPWGGGEEFVAWADTIRSQIKTSLCDNQHLGNSDILQAYAAATGLPVEEYISQYRDPDPLWLKRTPVLLLVGEQDRGHWLTGATLADKQEMWIGAKYRQHGAKKTHVVLIPRYGHIGYCERYNEKIVYSWLWALRRGYFEKR